jgi:hypothetical protein
MKRTVGKKIDVSCDPPPSRATEQQKENARSMSCAATGTSIGTTVVLIKVQRQPL